MVVWGGRGHSICEEPRGERGLPYREDKWKITRPTGCGGLQGPLRGQHAQGLEPPHRTWLSAEHIASGSWARPGVTA